MMHNIHQYHTQKMLSFIIIYHLIYLLFRKWISLYFIGCIRTLFLEFLRNLLATALESLTVETLYLFFSISVIYFSISFDNTGFIINKNTPFWYLLLYPKGNVFFIKTSLFFHYFSLLLH